MEAPSSPRSAALYYWGGNTETFNGIMDDHFLWEDVQPADDLQKKTAVKSSNTNTTAQLQMRDYKRRQLKFTLSMEDDDSHWMFLKPHSALSLRDCFVEADATTHEEEKLKDKLAIGKKDGSSGYRGYFGIGMEDLKNKDGTRDLVAEEGGDNTGKGDQKEGFDCGLENVSGYHENGLSRKAYIDFFGADSWPDECKHASVAGFRRTMVEYQQALLGLSDKLMIALAVSLSSGGASVPMDYFIAQSRNPMCTLRLLHYPPMPKSNNVHQRSELINSPNGCGAHTDYGLFTILQQDEIGGLQIRNKSMQWIDARPVPGSFVINVGDMLSWWTEGEFASTVHRVISPALRNGNEDDNESKHRYSIPFFFNPDHDAVVKPIQYIGSESGQSCQGKNAIEILKERYAGTFK
ncbi:hypothetical protein ACHAWO_011835 [Cyclotella atomus]|uniref:Fe2OG dioxygenase domain-containing protein n=1 Tax=Cyclotella atomus TaxID=382360 RepID=A0ABD3PKN4_9STRA